ncbi:unnamed protein product [Taenia asiatica]|uniref:BHLH domain-containing protein n=1 Tax=Taenia asiatica TaxID=60517 RepID=A0A0R3WEJ8_TAEAS|nr:unnamed protein product [Taenia asiatica]
MTPRRLENLAVYRKQQVIRILGENIEGRYMDNTASGPPSLPPPQPKPLFQRSPVFASSNPAYNNSICDKDLRMGEGERLDIQTTGSKPASISGILRRRWRQQHNLRERDRRREESILYEMIRTCLSEEHIRLHLPGVNKAPENLSYHQILRISLEMLKNEEGEMDLFNHHKMVVQTLEQECLKRGIPLPEDRPLVIPPMEKHRRYAKIVIEALRMDR